MLTHITKNSRSEGSDFRYSVLIPTWNNLPYLQLCIKSLRTNSSVALQIIVMINEGTDGTLEWVQAQPDLDYVHATQNIGICYGLNIARSLAKARYLVYVNDDMYLLPQWDTAIDQEIESIGHHDFLLSCLVIEPHFTNNSCVLVQDYGDSCETFEESRLLEEHPTMCREDWNGSILPPQILPTDLWDLVGGLSVEYSPGHGSGIDLCMKLWKTGVRHFRGVGSSKVYHFGSKTTRRLAAPPGRIEFLKKWGILPRFFADMYLKSGTPVNGQLVEPQLTFRDQLTNKIRLVTKSLH